MYGVCIILLNFIIEMSVCEIYYKVIGLVWMYLICVFFFFWKKVLNLINKNVNLKFKKFFYVKLISILMKKKYEFFF